MRIVVTGGAGMVGAALTRGLKDAGHETFGLGRASMDLLDATQVRSVLEELEPELVIHAAGRVGGIEANRRANSSFLVDNARMGFNVVEAARAAGIVNLLNLSSSCIYPRNRTTPLRESDLLTGELEPTNQGYALAKISVLYLCQVLNSENPELKFKTFIPCNLYGPGDHYEATRAHLIPAAIRKLAQAKAAGSNTVEIWGDGTARREFMHIADLTTAVTKAVDDWPGTPEVMNIGLGYDFSVREYYNAVAGAMGWQGDFVYDITRPTGMTRKLLDVSAAGEWGWKAVTTLEEGLRSTLDDFYARHLDLT